MTHFADEINLLLLSEQPADLQQAIAAHPLNWQKIVEMSMYHRTYPRLFSAVRPHSALLPDPIYQCLLERFMFNARQAISLSASLAGLLHRFEAAGIDAIPFKGPTLALAAYGHLTLRHAGDLDILIDRRSIDHATALLLDSGFEHQTSPSQRARALRDLYHLRLTHPQQRVHVELHWAFTRPAMPVQLDLARLMPRTHTIPLADTSIRTLLPEDLLLIVCLHGGKHLWTHLTWISDVAGLLRSNPALDWDYVLSTADQLGITRLLYVGLSIAQRLVSSPLPDAIHQRITGDPETAALVDVFAARLFDADRKTLSYREEDSLFFRLRERPRERAILLYHAMWKPGIKRLVKPTSRDESVLPLPPPLRWLYYVLRPFRLIIEAALRLTRLIRR